MSREEHLRELVRQGQALRQEDIDLGAKQEQERILELWNQEMKCECENPMQHLLTLIKEEK